MKNILITREIKITVIIITIIIFTIVVTLTTIKIV